MKLLIHPTNPPATITQAEFTLYLIKTNMDTINMPMANPSVKDAIPSLKLTTAISPKEAILTPSSIPDTQDELLSLGIIGFNAQTSKNEGCTSQQ